MKNKKIKFINNEKSFESNEEFSDNLKRITRNKNKNVKKFSQNSKNIIKTLSKYTKYPIVTKTVPKITAELFLQNFE